MIAGSHGAGHFCAYGGPFALKEAGAPKSYQHYQQLGFGTQDIHKATSINKFQNRIVDNSARIVDNFAKIVDNLWITFQGIAYIRVVYTRKRQEKREEKRREEKRRVDLFFFSFYR